ncbi:uncharacterized protein [Diadema antillarum]|uniref:uncharacterized protein n=1 Tax=Diadema antillarum TaxID=105358 RepID=UPI003A85DB89
MAKSRAKSRQAKSRRANSSSGRGRPASSRSPKGKTKGGRKPLEIKVTRTRGKKDAWESRAVFSSSNSGIMFRSIGVNTDPVEFAGADRPKRAKVPKNEPLLQKVVTYMRTFNHARALSALLTSPSVRSALPAVVEVEVRKEVQRFVKKPLSFPSPQIVATGDKTHRITESAWGHILAEFKKEMPVFYMSCMAALAPKNKQYTINNPDSYESSNRGRLGMMMTIPLFTRRERKFQYLSSLIGGQLWRHGCRQRIFHELYRLGVSQRRHGSMDAARWLEGETSKGNRMMKQKYQIMDEVEALQNGVLPSAERYETSDDDGSSESDDDESEEEVEESSDVDSEEDLIDESDEEDEIMTKPEKKGRGKKSLHQQMVIEEAVVDENWQGDMKGRKSASEVVISEMVKIAEQMSETSQQMKTSMRKKKAGRATEEVTVVSQDENQIVVQVSKDGLAEGIPISMASTAEGVPIMVASTGQDGGAVNINQVMMGGVPTQIVQQEVVTEEMDAEMMAAQLLQHVLPTEMVTQEVATSQAIPQEIVTTTTIPAEGMGTIQEEVVTIQTSGPPEDVQQTIVTHNEVPAEEVQEQLVQQEQIIQEIIPEEIIQQEVITEGEVTAQVVPHEILTADMGSGEMTTVVVTTEVVTTDEGSTEVVMVAQDEQTPTKRPAEAEPESEGKRKRKKTAPYSP